MLRDQSAIYPDDPALRDVTVEWEVCILKLIFEVERFNIRTVELFNRQHDLYTCNYRAMYRHRMGTLQRIANFSASQ